MATVSSGTTTNGCESKPITAIRSLSLSVVMIFSAAAMAYLSLLSRFIDPDLSMTRTSARWRSLCSGGFITTGIICARGLFG